MVILQHSPDSVKMKMKSYFKRVVYRPGGRKIDKRKRKNSNKCGYLGDDERAQLTRTFSPPTPRARPFPLIISHQSEETLHHIDSDSCCIGSAGSSHSSGFNESMLDTFDTAGNPMFSSAPTFDQNEYNLNQMRDEESLKRPGSVFEGFGGPDIVETLDYKDMTQMIKSLKHKNKVLTQERRELENQLGHQEEVLDQMELEIAQIKREKRDVEKLKKDEGCRMRSENKELEDSLDKLRSQRAEAEHKLEVMERERAANKMQLEEVRLQLQQAIDEHELQKERNNDLIRQLENKERQLSSLADDYKHDSDLNLASQYKIDELNRENLEMRRHVAQLKNDKELLAANLTKITCELSRLQQGVPLSPDSTNSSLTSPIVDEIYGRQDPSTWNYHSLPPVFEEGDTIDELLCNKSGGTADTVEALDEIEHNGYINLNEIMEERYRLIERNEMLEQELNDMKQLMYVVAPQHYIDDEALHFNNASNNRVQYSKPNNIQYECMAATQLLSASQMRLTPSLEVESDDETPNVSIATTLGALPDLQDISQMSCTPSPDLVLPEDHISSDHVSEDQIPVVEAGQVMELREQVGEENTPSPTLSSADSREPSDDADSGVNCQSSTDLCEQNCDSCTLWHPEKEMLMSKVVKTELDLEKIRCERDRFAEELNQLQPHRWRGWILHLTALVILLFFLSTCYPLFSYHQCKHSNFAHWTDFFSFKVVHLRHRTYQVPH